MIPGCSKLFRFLRTRAHFYGANPFLRFSEPGHYYSPIPDLKEIERYRDTIFDQRVAQIPGIELNAGEQNDLLREFSKFAEDLPFKDNPTPGLRFYYLNRYFGYADTVILYSMLRHFRPKRVIEVGSGYSSAVILDTSERFFANKIELTCIEPFPERLFSLLSAEDQERHEFMTESVQDVPIERFDALQANDILVIDSSHVAKAGSDVNYLLTHVLPRLNDEVIIHFHDICWPFEYPEQWIRQGRAWNESYVLKAFLQFNTRFKILFFNSYMESHHRDALERYLPIFLKGDFGSLWIRKTSQQEIG